MKILLIEPDTQLGSIYTDALAKAGHEVLFRRDAQAAIETAESSQIDLVILELQLARHNGVEFLYEFRSYPDWQGIPIILHTSVDVLPASQDLLKRLGVQATHYKPKTTLAQLVKSVEQTLALVNV